jgi:Queuine tRNA-ribosyltransferase
MKFIFADSLDLVDPDFDFASDTHSNNRRSNWGDRYPHELMTPAPYHGMLVSRSIVGDYRARGKYTMAQQMRFQRSGARRFLRLEGARLERMPIFGDCGAFSYSKEDRPPYTPSEILKFYADGQFTHGCAVDHIIFEFNRDANSATQGSEVSRVRYDITLENAQEFLRESRQLGGDFTPIGVAQGWSAVSLATAAKELERMGYAYVAIGGLVRLNSQDIHRCLTAVRAQIRSTTRLHLLGCAKPEQIQEFQRYGIESFDSTSPLLRAFKDARANYYVLSEGRLTFYTALRIPQATEASRLVRMAREGRFTQEKLLELEQSALQAVRGYDRNQVSLRDTVERVANYGSLLAEDPAEGSPSREKLRRSICESAARTLANFPWRHCRCEICRSASIEVLIFRGANRNKRRGFHNLGVYRQYVEQAQSRNAHLESRRTEWIDVPTNAESHCLDTHPDSGLELTRSSGPLREPLTAGADKRVPLDA